MRLCNWIGHKRPKGYFGGIAYGEARRITTDGIGREHWTVLDTCERCGRKFQVAKFHKEASNGN